MEGLNINITEVVSNTLYIPGSIFIKESNQIEPLLSVSFNSSLVENIYYLKPISTSENSLHALKKYNEELHLELLNKNIPHNLSIVSFSEGISHVVQNWLHWFNELGEARTEVYSRYIIDDEDIDSDIYKEKLFDASVAVSRYIGSVEEFNKYMLMNKLNQAVLRDIYLGKKLLST